MSTPFRYAHAAGEDWREIVQSCLKQLSGGPPATLGFIYLTDPLAAHADGLDLDRVRAVRAATTLPLQVDVNGYWSLDEALELVCAELAKNNKHVDARAMLESARQARIMFAAGPVFNTLTQELVRMDDKHRLNKSIYTDILVNGVIGIDMYETVNVPLYVKGGCDVATGATLVASSGSLIR